MRRHRALMPLEGDQRAHRYAEFFDFLCAAEIRQVDDKAGGKHIGAATAAGSLRGLGIRANRAHLRGSTTVNRSLRSA